VEQEIVPWRIILIQTALDEGLESQPTVDMCDQLWGNDGKSI
jgi:hypothetical protein